MSRRPDRWWMRWYLVHAVPAFVAGSIAVDADEYVEAATFTRWQARRFLEREVGDMGPMYRASLRIVRRTVWLEEHE